MIFSVVFVGLLESIIQRLSDEFSKQPVGMQEVLFERHMAVKGSLYSCSAGGQQRAADCHCRLMLHTISTHFKAQLRPKGLSAQDVVCYSKDTRINWMWYVIARMLVCIIAFGQMSDIINYLKCGSLRPFCSGCGMLQKKH